VTVATGISGHVIKHYCDRFVPVPLAYSCTSNCFVLSTLLTCREIPLLKGKQNGGHNPTGANGARNGECEFCAFTGYSAKLPLTKSQGLKRMSWRNRFDAMRLNDLLSTNAFGA
jgi:hypothetical protein